jgi:gluconolactonase
MSRIFFVAIMSILLSCNSNQSKDYKTIGSIERVDPSLNAIMSENAKAEIIAEGFDWSEGPLWIENQKNAYFFRCACEYDL